MNLEFKGKSCILSCVASLVEAVGVNGNSQESMVTEKTRVSGP